nr:MAG TPA: hypothetical protein [Caudoviricetes sp.]
MREDLGFLLHFIKSWSLSQGVFKIPKKCFKEK